MRAMKDSGIEWIGKIPEDFTICKLKSILEKNSSGVWGSDPLLDGTDCIVLRSTEQTVDGIWDIQEPALRNLSEKERDESNKINSGDLLITKSSGSTLHIGKTTLATQEVEDMCCYFSNFIQRIRTNNTKALPRFIWYLLNSPYTREQFVFLQNSTSGIGNINAQNIDDIQVALPAVAEQQRIADFLDEKCADIDTAISEAKASIEDYKLLKQSIITKAVTKGLTPNAEMKDSGIEWIGKVPKEWKVCKTLYALSMPITDGPHTTPELYSDGIPFVSAEAVSCGNGNIDFAHIRGYISQEFYDECCRKYIPQRDDVYMIKSGATTGKVAIVDTDEMFTIWSPLAVFRCNLNMALPKFLFYFLQSNGYQKQIELNWSYGTQQNIGMRTLEKLMVCLPTVTEQKRIADYLDDKCSTIDTLVSEKEQIISELEAYKKSLIFEYVTGKKEVA